MYFDDPAAVLPACVERLGARAGRQFAALARRGFLLERPDGRTEATGRCQLGGSALLNPGTAWPQADGFPLSLHAVLDIAALPWLGEALPPFGPGLLNFFYADPDVPFETCRRLDFRSPEMCRVIPADPTQAVEIAAPSFLLDAMDGLDGNIANRHCAFGWPDTSYANRVTSRHVDGPDVHLLQLAQDTELGWNWGDAATLYFTIPAGSYAAGDFTAARLVVQSC